MSAQSPCHVLHPFSWAVLTVPIFLSHTHCTKTCTHSLTLYQHMHSLPHSHTVRTRAPSLPRKHHTNTCTLPHSHKHRTNTCTLSLTHTLFEHMRSLPPSQTPYQHVHSPSLTQTPYQHVHSPSLTQTPYQRTHFHPKGISLPLTHTHTPYQCVRSLPHSHTHPLSHTSPPPPQSPPIHQWLQWHQEVAFSQLGGRKQMVEERMVRLSMWNSGMDSRGWCILFRRGKMHTLKAGRCSMCLPTEQQVSSLSVWWSRKTHLPAHKTTGQ